MKLKKVLVDYGIYITFVIICIIFACLSDNFFTVNNLLNIVRQISFSGIIAVGMTFVIISDGIDLSVGAVSCLAGIIASQLCAEGSATLPTGLAILIALAVSAFCGFICGSIIAKFKIAPFIGTMAAMEIYRGIALVITGGRPVNNLTASFKTVGAGYLFGIPLPIYFLLFALLLGWFILSFTRFGRHVYAVGGSELASRYSGLGVMKIRIGVYTLCAALAGLAGIVYASRVGAGSPTAGEGAELDAIAAVAIGGASMSGGVGRISGTLVGALLIGIIGNGMDLMNVSSYYQRIIKGIIIIAAVLTDRKDK